MAQGAEIVRPVEQLRDADLAPAPVAGSNRVVELVGDDAGPDGRAYHVASPLLSGPLELVLHVPHQVSERCPEEVREHLPGELDNLVTVMVLVVLLDPAEPQLEELADGLAEEHQLVVASVLGLAEVWQKAPVEGRLGPLDPELFEHPVRDTVADVNESVLLCRRLAGLDEGDLQEVLDLLLRGDGVRDLLVRLYSHRPHDDDEGEVDGAARDLYVNRPILFEADFELGTVADNG